MIKGVHTMFYSSDAEATRAFIRDTVTELKAKGVEFIDDIFDVGYGLRTHFKIPGGITVQLDEPIYGK